MEYSYRLSSSNQPSFSRYFRVKDGRFLQVIFTDGGGLLSPAQSRRQKQQRFKSEKSEQRFLLNVIALRNHFKLRRKHGEIRITPIHSPLLHPGRLFNVGCGWVDFESRGYFLGRL